MYERFDELRIASGLSMSEIAKRIGVSKSTLSMWKNGKIIPKTSTMQLIADFFGVSLDYLVGKTDKSNTQYTTKVEQFAEMFSKLPTEWQDEYIRRISADLKLLKK